MYFSIMTPSVEMWKAQIAALTALEKPTYDFNQKTLGSIQSQRIFCSLSQFVVVVQHIRVAWVNGLIYILFLVLLVLVL